MFTQIETPGFKARLKEFGENAWIVRTELLLGVLLIFLDQWLKPTIEQSKFAYPLAQYALIGILVATVQWIRRKQDGQSTSWKHMALIALVYGGFASIVDLSSTYWNFLS
jgi:hypothetical protein